MPLLIEMPDAAPIVKNYIWGPPEKTFKFPEAISDFSSTGIASHDEFVSTVDGDPVVRSFRNMTINANHIVRPTNRCKGMFIHVSGNLVINGQLTMTARGAKAEGKYVGIDKVNREIYFHSTNIYPEDPRFSVIGANGGARRTVVNTIGTSGIDGACGGGGCGSVENSFGGSNGFGAAGTSFSGGAGGGGSPRAAGGNGVDGGGAGGAGVSWYSGTRWWPAGGGAGNPGGAAGTSGYSGNTGTGGLIILFVDGTITFGTNGRILSQGSAGGAGYDGGGGSGGGAIHIFHKGNAPDQTKLSVLGGGGGPPLTINSITGISGFSGGVGSIRVEQI